MKLKIMYKDFGNSGIKIGELTVEEKVKIYKVETANNAPFYGSVINKDIINKVHDNHLIFNCSEDEAKQIWNNKKNEEIEDLKLRINKLENEKIN